MNRRQTLAGHTYEFPALSDLLAKATPARSGDVLAGVAAESEAQRVAAQLVLADVPLATFLEEQVVGYDDDDVTRLILDTHDAAAFAPVSSLTVGEFREWLLARAALLTLVVYGLFLAYFGLYSRHHLVAAAPEEEFAALAAADEELR